MSTETPRRPQSRRNLRAHGEGAHLAARERALLHLLDETPLTSQLPEFLLEVGRILPFDCAILTGIDEEEPGIRAWRRRGSGGPLDEVDPAPPIQLPPAPASEDREEITDSLLLAGLRSYGLRGGLRLFFLPSPDRPISLLLGREVPESFREDHVEAVAPLWPALARAFRREERRRHAEADSRQRSLELSALFELVRAAGRALDFDELFEGLCAALQPVMDLDLLVVLLELGGRQALTFHLARPLLPEASKVLLERCRDAFRREVGREASVCEVRLRPLAGYDPQAPPLQRSPALFEILPLLRRGEKAGLVAAVAETGRLTESVSRLLATAAGQASITVDRLQSGAEAQAAQLRAVIDSMSDGVIMADPDWRIRMLNPAAREHLLLLTGREDPGYLSDLGGADVREVSSDVSSGRADSASLEISLPASRRLLYLIIHPLAGPGHGQAGFVVVTSDITEARALQDQMLQTEKLSALGEMISGVAHELNNPLAAVMGYAQLLQSSRVRPEVRRRLEIINSEAQRCQRIVRNLLSFARKHRPERKPLSLNEVVQSVLGLLAYQLRVEGIEVDRELDDSLPAVLGDFHELQQVLLNIVTNAQQAMKQARGPKRLGVRSRRVEGWARVEVEDTGPGIPAEHLPRVFDPFFTTKEVGQGTGLGLSIAYGILKSHGGRVSAWSGPEGGAVFSIDLPSGRPVAEAAAEREAEFLPSSVPGRSILVVEDEEAVSSLLRDALSSEGHRVEAVADGGVARDKLARRDYDVIITDLKMPRAGGRELYEEMASTRPDMARRFIFATGDVASSEARAFFEKTGRPYLEKPFDVRDLRRLVRELLGDN